MIIQTIVQSASLNNIDSELLLAHTLGKPREFIVAHPEAKVGLFDYWKFKRLVHKRKRGVPIAYLTGHKEFYGLDFVVTKDVLIPRPETETLVDAVNEQLTINNLPRRLASLKLRRSGQAGEQKILLIDVGTGSGCIPISVIKTLKHENIKAIGIDISKKALKVAKKNAQRHGVDIEFLHGSLLEPLLKSCSMFHDPCSILITANLPYLTEQQFYSEPSIQHEPKSALVAEDNGLALYEKLLQQIRSFVTCYVVRVTCFFEIDPSQSSAMRELIYENLRPASTRGEQAQVKIKKDLAGRDRVVVVEQL